MKKVNISKIKAELSKYLRFVKSGQEVLIVDRDQPVAKLVGVELEQALSIRAPSTDLKAVLLKSEKRSFTEKSDILDVLAQDREDRF